MKDISNYIEWHLDTKRRLVEDKIVKSKHIKHLTLERCFGFIFPYFSLMDTQIPTHRNYSFCPVHLDIMIGGHHSSTLDQFRMHLDAVAGKLQELFR